MADVSIARLVDEQRSQVNWLLSQDELMLSPKAESVMLTGAVRAMHIYLTAVFAECTQPRFDAALWSRLLACQGSFARMSSLVDVESVWLNEWLALESTDEDHGLNYIIAAIGKVNTPMKAQFKSGLLRATSLAEELPMIASTARDVELERSELQAAFTALDEVLQRQRSQALEC